MIRLLASACLLSAPILLSNAPPPPAATTPNAAALMVGPGQASRTRHMHRALQIRHDRAPETVRSALRAATREPDGQGFMNAIQVYPYAEGSIFRAYTTPGQITDVALQPGEALISVAAGDTTRWVVGDTSSGTGDAKRSHILVKPFAAGLSTNMVITTDRRVYYVALASMQHGGMAALSWTYPADQLIAMQKASAAALAAAPVAANLDIAALQFDYRITGDKPAWRPSRVFDDGRQTFIEFPADLATGDAPPLFLIGSDGKAELVNYRVQGHFYVVDRLFAVAELRLGRKHQAIVRITRGSGKQRNLA